MGRNLLLLGLLLAGLTVGLTLLNRSQSKSPSGPNAELRVPSVPAIRGKKVPDFALPDLAGKTAHPADFKDKVVLVNFWATWCGPCIVEIPWFVEFQKKYGPEGLQIVGISMDEGGAKDVEPFVKKHKMDYTVLLGNEETATQFGGIVGLPTTFLVDRNGKFYSMHRGLVGREMVEQEIQELLKKSDSARLEMQPAANGQ